MSYSAKLEKWSGEPAWVLRGPENASATILPGVGANLVQLALPPAPGRPAVEVMSAPADVETLRQWPSRYGAPVLFPFPGRIAAGRFTYDGQTHQVEVAQDDGNARHGFVMARPFTAVDHGANAESAWVTLTIDGNLPEVQRQFPYPFRLTMTFRLSQGGLSLDIEGTNTGTATMPMGFGWHPYFRMPLLESGRRESCVLTVPAAEYWELVKLLPTGRRLPVSGRLDMRQGIAVQDNAYDDILTAVEHDAAGFTNASLTDPAGMKVTVSAGPSFREWVIYTPPGRPAVCLEPYTCAGDAFNLQAKGLDAGAMDVAPGQSWSDSIRVFAQAV